MPAGNERRRERPAPPSIWRDWRMRVGAAVVLVGGILATAANLSEIAGWLLPDETAELVRETRSALESTDDKVDELLRLLRDEAASAGRELDPSSERTIREAVLAMLTSGDARKQQAVRQLVEGDIDAAAAGIEQVARDLESATLDSAEAAAESWREAGALYFTSDIDAAVRSYEAAYRLLPDDPVNGNELAYAYSRAGRLTDAIDLFHEVLRLSPGNEIRIEALHGMGGAYRQRGEYDAAQGYFDDALRIASAIGDRGRESLVRLRLGNIDEARGNYEPALAQYETALGYAREVRDRHLTAMALNNLGKVLVRTQRFDEAEAAMSESLELYRQDQDLSGQAIVIGNLGATALSRGELDDAEAYLAESIALGERLGWERSLALDLVNLGGIAAARGEYDAADGYLERARRHAVAAELEELLPLITVNRGEVARDRGDLPAACVFWAQALPQLEAMQHAALEVVRGYRQQNGC